MLHCISANPDSDDDLLDNLALFLRRSLDGLSSGSSSPSEEEEDKRCLDLGDLVDAGLCDLDLDDLDLIGDGVCDLDLAVAKGLCDLGDLDLMVNGDCDLDLAVVKGLCDLDLDLVIEGDFGPTSS